MMPICFPRSGANFCDSRTSSPVWTRPAREYDQAKGTTEGTTRGGDAGRQDFLLITVDCDDILERSVVNRVVALSCVCYQQGEAGRASRDSERFGRIDAAETPRLVV